MKMKSVLVITLSCLLTPFVSAQAQPDAVTYEEVIIGFQKDSFEVFTGYCNEQKPELKPQTDAALDSFMSDFEPLARDYLNQDERMQLPLTLQEQAQFDESFNEILEVVRADTYANADPDVYCPALINKLHNIDADNYLNSVIESWEAMKAKSD